MDDLRVTAGVPAHLSWDYKGNSPRIRSLYQHAVASQWSASADVDWSLEVPYGEPLPDDSSFALAAFASSPLGRFGRPMWDRFRWEFQCWMVSQFMHGEQGALVATARLAEVMTDVDAKCCAASQVADEARHLEVFSRYLDEKMPEAYAISGSFADLLASILSDSRWDITALGMQIIVEGLAMSAFRLGATSFHDPLIHQILRLVIRDEARHVSFGVLTLREVYADMTSAELKEREDFVIEAAHLTLQRLLLEDIWERVGVDTAEGVAFAATNEMMILYRHALFAKVASALRQIGLLNDRLRERFESLSLAPAVGVGR